MVNSFIDTNLIHNSYINYIKLSFSTCFERHPLIFRRSMMLNVHVCSLWYCNVQNYRLLLWFDKFENLLLNACPSYEVMECRKTVVLPCKIIMSARPSYVPRIPYMEILGRAIYQNPRKSLRSSKGVYLNSHPCDTILSKFSLDESTSVAACNSLLNKPPT